jgi:hypothetical protein
MERLLDEQPQVTDWIPCTTPPVRDGAYEVQSAPGGRFGKDLAIYEDGRWRWPDGLDSHGLNNYPDQFVWRGRRMWVLARETTHSKSGITYLQRIPKWGKRAGVPHWHFDLAEAMGFDSELDADIFRLVSCLSPAKAVKP